MKSRSNIALEHAIETQRAYIESLLEFMPQGTTIQSLRGNLFNMMRFNMNASNLLAYILDEKNWVDGTIKNLTGDLVDVRDFLKEVMEGGNNDGDLQPVPDGSK